MSFNEDDKNVDNEWGNQELPGLSDEKLLNTNWIMVAACKERSKNPDWIHKNKEASQNPIRNKKISKTLKSKNLTMSEEKKQYLSKLHKGKSISSELRSHLSEIKQGESNPMFGKHHSNESKKKMGAKNSKALMTPGGIFKSQTAAAKYYGIKQPDIFYKLKRFPDQYYYCDTDGNRIKND